MRVVGDLIMTDRFMSAVLAALNESTEVEESDWKSITATHRATVDAADAVQQAVELEVSENRFAETVSFGMAKVRTAG
jgi:hypothetical protein